MGSISIHKENAPSSRVAIVMNEKGTINFSKAEAVEEVKQAFALEGD
jgi:hypothetical protein